MSRILRITTSVPATPEAVEAYINGGLPGLNFFLMRDNAKRGVPIPPAVGTTLRYVPEPRGSEHWQNCCDLTVTGEGDCEDLASYEVARYRMNGEPATVAIVRTTPTTMHAVVRRADGRIEDPARALRDRYANPRRNDHPVGRGARR